jgi:hypothetical protein
MKAGQGTLCRRPSRRIAGLTLLEVVIVLAICGMLLQLMLPAVQAAREAARQLHCANNLRQIGLAIGSHHDAFARYPSGGWHFTWVGEPERGTGRDQPGSWIFNLLDYFDQPTLRRAGWAQTGAARDAALAGRCRTPLGLFVCPTRRDAAAYPQTWNRQPWTRGGQLQEPLDWSAKSDYAANVGDGPSTEFDWRWLGPESLEAGDDPTFVWPSRDEYTGIIFGRSQVRQRQVRDGLSQTYLVAEKYLDPLHYETGEDFGDNENLFAGFNNDVCRTTIVPPRRDQAALDWRNGFGSAHAHSWRALMCDLTVRALRYDLDPEIHRAQGHRVDGRRTKGIVNP